MESAEATFHRTDPKVHPAPGRRQFNVAPKPGWNFFAGSRRNTFASSIRASGHGVGYSLAVILPAFYEFYVKALGNIMPDRFAVASLICLAGVLVWIGATMGPETKDVNLADDASFTV